MIEPTRGGGGAGSDFGGVGGRAMSALPLGWSSSKLGEVTDLEMGQAPAGSACNTNGQGTVFVKAGEFGATYPIIREWTTKPLKFAREGDILICVVGATAGKLNLGIDCAIGRSVAAIRPRSPEMQKTIYGQLKLQVMTLRADSTGSAQGVISKQMLSDIDIVVPPLQEQKRIADKLDSVLTRVDAVNTRLARVAPLLKRFRQSVLSAAVNGGLITEASLSSPKNWRSVTLGDLIEDGPKNGLYKPSSAYGAGVRILRIDSFYDGKVSDWASLRLLSIDSSELKQFGLMNGDLVINRVNSIEYLGKCALVEGLQGECVFESNMMRFRLSPRLANPRFIRTWLCSEAARTQIVAKAKHAVNQASINQSDVCGLKLQLPPLSEQTEIVRRVETLFAFADRLEARLAQAQTAATRLTPALLAKAFRGELVPQDPNDEPVAELLRRLQAERASAPKASAGRGRKAVVQV